MAEMEEGGLDFKTCNPERMSLFTNNREYLPEQSLQSPAQCFRTKEIHTDQCAAPQGNPIFDIWCQKDMLAKHIFSTALITLQFT